MVEVKLDSSSDGDNMLVASSFPSSTLGMYPRTLVILGLYDRDRVMPASPEYGVALAERNPAMLSLYDLRARVYA